MRRVLARDDNGDVIPQVRCCLARGGEIRFDKHDCPELNRLRAVKTPLPKPPAGKRYGKDDILFPPTVVKVRDEG